MKVGIDAEEQTLQLLVGIVACGVGIEPSDDPLVAVDTDLIDHYPYWATKVGQWLSDESALVPLKKGQQLTVVVVHEKPKTKRQAE